MRKFDRWTNRRETSLSLTRSDQHQNWYSRSAFSCTERSSKKVLFYLLQCSAEGLLWDRVQKALPSDQQTSAPATRSSTEQRAFVQLRYPNACAVALRRVAAAPSPLHLRPAPQGKHKQPPADRVRAHTPGQQQRSTVKFLLVCKVLLMQQHLLSQEPQ